MKSFSSFLMTWLLLLSAVLSCNEDNASSAVESKDSESTTDTVTDTNDDETSDSDGTANASVELAPFPTHCQFDYAPDTIDAYDWIDSEWIFSYREQYLYNDSGLLFQIQYYESDTDETLYANTEVDYAYDTLGRLAEITACNEDQTICTQFNYEYEENSPLPSRMYRDGNAENAPEISYENNRLAQISTGRYVSGDQSDGGSIYEYTYDDDGRATMEMYTHTGAVVVSADDTDETDYSNAPILRDRTVWTYDDEGHLLRLEVQGENQDGIWELDSSIDYIWQNSRLIEIRKNEDQADITITYTDDGRIASFTSSRFWNSDAEPDIARYDYTYTTEGNSCFFERFNEIGTEFSPILWDFLLFYGQGETNMFATF